MIRNVIGGRVVGGYAASPAHRNWDPALELAFLNGIAAIPGVAALELPWLGSLHPHDDTWLLANLPASLRAVLTDIPATASRVARELDFGLASSDDAGRRAALSSAAAVRDDVARLNDARGSGTVAVVELHAAPRASRGHALALARSLEELASWDWQGAELVIEHCDAERPGQDPQKGFLDLDAEIAAIRSSGTDVGISLNWGRSAIELRSGDRVAEQVRSAAASGMLRGFMFSGASAADGPFGPPWTDAHHTFRLSPQHPFGDPDSLLTDARLVDAFAAAGPLAWSGVKVGWPGDDGSVADRVAMIRHAVLALDRAEAGMNG